MEEETKKTSEEEGKTSFEKHILPILKYIGLIGAILMSIAYIVVTIILVVGFEQNELKGDIIFALVNAAIGLIIMFFLKVQGISFAKNLPKNKAIIEEYYNSKTKDKKIRSIKYYWLTSTIWDVLIKAVTVMLTTFGLIYIVIEGSHDYMLFLLAIVNLMLFSCFGLLSLSQAYDFYNNRHIPYLKEQLKIISKKENIQDVENRKQDIQKPRRTSTRKSKKHSITL